MTTLTTTTPVRIAAKVDYQVYNNNNRNESSSRRFSSNGHSSSSLNKISSKLSKMFMMKSSILFRASLMAMMFVYLVMDRQAAEKLTRWVLIPAHY